MHADGAAEKGLSTGRELVYPAAAATLAAAAVVVAWSGRFDSFARIPDVFNSHVSYIQHAQAWAAGAGPLSNERPPLYGLLLGLLARASGPYVFAYWAAAAHAVMAWLAGMLAFFEGRRLAGGAGWAGLLATALVAGNLALQWEMLSPRETVVQSILLLLIMGGLAGGGATGWRAAAGLGVLAGLAWLNRPTGIAVVAALMVVVYTKNRGQDARGPYRGVLWMLAGVAAPLVVWMGYQIAQGMEPAVSGRAGGRTLYYSWHPAMATIYPLVDVDELDPFVDAAAARWRLEGFNEEEQFRREALGFLRDRPGEFASLAPRKLAAFLLPIQFPPADGHIVYTDGRWEIENFRLLPLRGLMMGLYSLAGTAAFLLCLLRLRRLPAPVLFAVLATALTAGIHVVFFAETRYRQPLDPMLAVVAVWVVAEAVRRRSGAQQPALGAEQQAV